MGPRRGGGGLTTVASYPGCDETFKRVRPLRDRWPAGLCIYLAGHLASEKSSGGSAPDYLNPASLRDMGIAEHSVVDMAVVAKELNEKCKRRGGKIYYVKKRKCSYAECKITKPKLGRYFCGACRGGKGRYYHLPCFNETHFIFMREGRYTK